MNTRLGRPWAAGLAVAVAAILLVPAGALADTELGHRGVVGAHMLRDTADHPGVACFYRESGRLRGFRVRPPQVRARDVTAEVDAQRVAWQFVIQRRSTDTADWTRFYVSPRQVARAYDNQAAAFAAMIVSPPLPSSDTSATDYRVIVRMFWLRDGEVEGRARHLVDWYRWRTVDGSDTETVGPAGDCAGWWA